MKRTLMLAVSLLVAVAASGEPIAGTWASNRFGDGQIWIQLNAGTGWTMGFSEPLSAMRGLAEATIVSPSAAAARFALEREAGTVEMEGTFRSGRGSGVFDFTPDAGFARKLADAGVRVPGGRIDDRTLLLFTLSDLSIATIRELQSLGMRNLDLEEVEAIAVHRITPEYVREMRGLGLTDLSIDDVVALRIHGASAAWVREMTSLGLPRPDKERIVEWRVHGVSPKFVRELHELGYREVTPEQLVAMRIHGVTPQFIRELREAGYEAIPADKLVDLRIRGITAKQLRKKE